MTKQTTQAVKKAVQEYMRKETTLLIQKAVAQSVTKAIKNFTKAILHGDPEHQNWLKQAAKNFIEGKPIPEVKPKPRKRPTLHNGAGAG